LDSLKRNSLKRFSDLDYDSFVGLMGRRAAGEFLTEYDQMCIVIVIIIIIIIIVLMIHITLKNMLKWHCSLITGFVM